MISHFREPMDIASSNFGEESVVFGGKQNLFDGLKHVIEGYHPNVIGIATTCLAETIGDDVSIGSLSCIEHRVKIGKGVRIHSQAFIPEFSTLKDNCWVGPNVVFTNAPHPQCPKVKECLKGPTVEEGAKIGANSTILPGVVIGKNALVGAGSVVVKDVPPRTVMAGNPARAIKKINELGCKFKLIKAPYAQE